MFSLIKNFLKEKDINTDSVLPLSELHVGCMVGFGFMPQTTISGRRLPVTELNSYLFDGDHFISYRLEASDLDVNLIVAEGSDMAGSYLALSQRLDESKQERFFSACPPADWFALAEGESLTLSIHALSLPQGWFAPRYTLAMKSQGRLLEGDYRLRKPAGRLSLSQGFDYVLLVDEANGHALEAERYDDGELKVFATVYRPTTDIGEITRPMRFTPPVAEERTAPPLHLETMRTLSEVQKEFAPDAQAETEPAEEPARAELHHYVVAAQTDVTPVHSKFGRIQPATTPAGHNELKDMLICDTRLAGKIIGESQRNQMPLSELIRKVIDLPASIHEQVLVPFALSDMEYAELARRYDLPPSDHEAVREQILEELRNFVGDR